MFLIFVFFFNRNPLFHTFNRMVVNNFRLRSRFGCLQSAPSPKSKSKFKTRFHHNRLWYAFYYSVFFFLFFLLNGKTRFLIYQFIFLFFFRRVCVCLFYLLVRMHFSFLLVTFLFVVCCLFSTYSRAPRTEIICLKLDHSLLLFWMKIMATHSEHSDQWI